MATHSSTLACACKIPWTKEPGRLQSMGSRRVVRDWATSLSLFTFMHWRRKWQPTPVLLPGESQGWEPGGPPSMGSHRVGHDWCDLAAAAAVSTWATSKLHIKKKKKKKNLCRVQRIFRYWKYYVWLHNDEYMSLYALCYPQTALHQEQTIMSTMDFGWLWFFNTGSSVLSTMVV